MIYCCVDFRYHSEECDARARPKLGDFMSLLGLEEMCNPNYYCLCISQVSEVKS